MINNWFTLSQVYVSIQSNSFLHFFKNIPILSGVLPANTYKNRVIKYLAAVFGTAFGLVKSAISTVLASFFAIHLIPQWLSGINKMLVWPDNSISALLYIILICLVPALTQSKIFKSNSEDYIFLNHFMLNPEVYYHSKIIKGLLKDSLFQLPVLIFLFKDGLLVSVLALTKLFFVAVGDSMFLSIYTKKRRLMGVKKRLLFSMGIIFVTYGLFYFGALPRFTIKSNLLVYIIVAEIIILIVCIRYLLSFKDYKKIAVQYANKDVVGLKISVNTPLNEDETGLAVSDWKANQEYFIANNSADMWSYTNSALIKRYKKTTSDSYKQTVYSNIFIGLIIGLLIRYGILDINSTNVLSFSSVVIPLVLNSIIGRTYLLTCFWYMDAPFLYHHLYDAKTVTKSMKKRYVFLLRNGFISISSLMFGILILLWVGGISIPAVDLLGLCLVYCIIYVIYETYQVIIYYIAQPYTSEFSVRSPIFYVISMIESLFGIAILFTRSNVLQLIMPLTVSLVIILILFFIAMKLAPKTFRLRR